MRVKNFLVCQNYYCIMPTKHKAIITLGIGDLIVRLSKKMGVRKIACHLEENNYLFKGKPISFSTVSRFLTDHRKGALPPSVTAPTALSEHGAVLKGMHNLDVDKELLHTFNSCRKMFDAQCTTINRTIDNGQTVDMKSMRVLLATAKTILEHLDIHIKRTQGFVSGQAIQAALNQQSHTVINIINFTLSEMNLNESLTVELRAKLADNFARPPEEIFRTGP